MDRPDLLLQSRCRRQTTGLQEGWFSLEFGEWKFTVELTGERARRRQMTDQMELPPNSVTNLFSSPGMLFP
jgi:hypothetical protein